MPVVLFCSTTSSSKSSYDGSNRVISPANSYGFSVAMVARKAADAVDFDSGIAVIPWRLASVIFILCPDLHSSSISHHSVRSVFITVHKLTPLKRDQLLITGHIAE